MKITVEMDIAEFAEFQKYLQGKSQARIANKRTELLAKKVIYALGIDEKGKKKVKIIDHEHAVELLEMASDYLFMNKRRDFK